MFEDRQMKKFFVYTIVNRSKKSSIIDEMLIGKKNKKKKSYNDIYDFVQLYEINMFESDLIKEKYGICEDDDG